MSHTLSLEKTINSPQCGYALPLTDMIEERKKDDNK